MLREFISGAEVQRLCDDVQRMIETGPIARGEAQNAHGDEVSHAEDFKFTDVAPDVQVLNRISHQLARSDVMLETYGNPSLLGAVESLYGEDFVPYAESIVIKLPGKGSPFAWHQDGSFMTGEQPERGVNFGIYLYPSNEENGCLYVVPGSHRRGRVDLVSMVKEQGERLTDSIPVPVGPGDVIVHSRNLVHGSFSNTSDALRVTVYFGFLPREAVTGVYEELHINRRARVIPLAVQMRISSDVYSDEEAFDYKGVKLSADDDPMEDENLLRVPALNL